ncbi:MAG: tetratricopeptide repeat protein [Armatimonadota bacterium]
MQFDYSSVNKLGWSQADKKVNSNMDAGFKAHMHYEKGLKLFKQGEYQKAADEFGKAVKLDKKHDIAYGYLGHAYFKMGNFKEAERCYKETLKINDKFPTAHLNLGTIYYKQGNLKQAEISYKKVIGMSRGIMNSKAGNGPKGTVLTAYAGLGSVYYDQNKFSDCAKMYENVIKYGEDMLSNKTKAVIHYKLSVAYYKSGNRKKAVENCRAAQKFGYNVPGKFLKLLKLK